MLEELYFAVTTALRSWLGKISLLIRKVSKILTDSVNATEKSQRVAKRKRKSAPVISRFALRGLEKHRNFSL